MLIQLWISLSIEEFDWNFDCRDLKINEIDIIHARNVNIIEFRGPANLWASRKACRFE